MREVFVTATLLLSTPAWGQAVEDVDPWTKDTPDEVDYIMAMECSALNAALAVFKPNAFPAYDAEHALLYRRWAETRAAEAGQDVSLVARDIAARRKDYLTEAGKKGTNQSRWTKLVGIHNGFWRACRSRANMPERIYIGG
jgi:hypothetical protein